MKPLNSSERTSALLKFSGIFIGTLLLAIFAVYFNVVGVPRQQLKYYEASNEALLDSVSSNSNLSASLAQLNEQLFKYQNNPADETAKSLVFNGVATLEANAQKDSTSYIGKISTQAAVAYKVAGNSIKKISESGNASEDISKLNDEIKKLKEDMKDKDNQINNLTLQLAIQKK